MAQIPLSKGFFAEVDDSDLDELSKYKWYAHKNGNCGFRAIRFQKREKCAKGRQRYDQIEMSHHLMGKVQGKCIDHVNRNPLDNRRINLRVATRQENSRNRIRKNKLGIPGVFKNGNRYSSRIYVSGKSKLELGTFKTPEEAHKAYVQAANLYFGEFSPYAHAV